MENKKIRGSDIGFLGDPDTEWMFDKDRREQIDGIIREMLKNSEFKKPKETIIIAPATPSKSWLYDMVAPNIKTPFIETPHAPIFIDNGTNNGSDNWRKHWMNGVPAIDTTKMFMIDCNFLDSKCKWYNKIVIPYISIAYDKYWHQIVFGHGKWKIGVGCIYWTRMFGIGMVRNKRNKTKHNIRRP